MVLRNEERFFLEEWPEKRIGYCVSRADVVVDVGKDFEFTDNRETWHNLKEGDLSFPVPGDDTPPPNVSSTGVPLG